MGEHDPRFGEFGEAVLAATTDAELVAGIRAAAWEVRQHAEAWRQSEHWRRATAVEQQAYESARAAWAALEAQGEDTPVDAAVAVVGPVLAVWWPSWPAEAQAAASSVERLRMAAMHRPTLVRHCRRLVAPEQRRVLAQHAAYGLWLDLGMGLVPALEIGEIRSGEIGEELEAVLRVVRIGATGWGELGRQVRDEIEAAASHLHTGDQAAAAQLLRQAATRLHDYATAT